MKKIALTWGMIAGLHPNGSGTDTQLVVEGEHLNGRPSDGRFGKYAGAVLAPCKMVGPRLSTRIEQRHRLTSGGVKGFEESPLPFVTQTTGEP